MMLMRLKPLNTFEASLKTNSVPDIFKLKNTTFNLWIYPPICLRSRQTEIPAEKARREMSCGVESAKEGKLIISEQRQVSEAETSCMSSVTISRTLQILLQKEMCVGYKTPFTAVLGLMAFGLVVNGSLRQPKLRPLGTLLKGCVVLKPAHISPLPIDNSLYTTSSLVTEMYEVSSSGAESTRMTGSRHQSNGINLQRLSPRSATAVSGWRF